MKFSLHARQIRTLGQFTAPDPWHGIRPRQFTIEEYVMMPPGLAQVDTSRYPHRVGLRVDADGSEHMLPEALVELWQSKQVAVERLPELAHCIAPRLRKGDFDLLLHKSLRDMLAIPMLAAFVIPVVVCLFAPLRRGNLSLSWSLLTGMGFSLLVFLIVFVVRQSGCSRRAKQMKWLLDYKDSVAPLPLPPTFECPGLPQTSPEVEEIMKRFRNRIAPK